MTADRKRHCSRVVWEEKTEHLRVTRQCFTSDNA